MASDLSSAFGLSFYSCTFNMKGCYNYGVVSWSLVLALETSSLLFVTPFHTRDRVVKRFFPQSYLNSFSPCVDESMGLGCKEIFINYYTWQLMLNEAELE